MKLKEMMFGVWCLVPGAKTMLAAALCAVGLSAFAEGSGTLDDPWKVGGTDGTDDLVAAWTNGTGVLTVQGAGSVTNLADVVKDGIMAINVANATVTGAVAQAFAGLGDPEPVALTLPDGWQGEFPDEDGNWYGAKVEMTAYPYTVRNVAFTQHWPWTDRIDVTCDLTGPAGRGDVVVTAYTNGTVKIADFTAAVTIPENGVLTTNLVWDASGLGDDFRSDDVTIEVAVDATVVSAKSETGTVDLRTNVTLDGTTIAGIAYSDTAWGAAVKANVTVGYTNLTTDATGVLSEGLIDAGATDVTLPKKNGEYVLTHSTGELTSFVKFTVSGFCTLKFPVGAHYTYVVSNETENVEVDGELADGTNTYAIAYGSTVKVYFTPEDGYVLKDGFVNPKDLDEITADTVVDASDLPTALALMGVAAFDAVKTYDGEATNVTWVVTNATGAVITDATVSLREQGTTAWIPVANFAPYVDVTNATVEVKAEKDGFTTASNKATVVISPRTVKLASDSEEWVYNAEAHSNMTVTAEGFVAGQGVATNGFATITNVGSEPNAFSYEFLEGTKAGNYLVSCVTGMLTVTKAKFNPATGPDGVHPAAGVDPEDPVKVADPTIPFSSFDTTNVYDGVGHTIDTNALENAYKDLFLGNMPSFEYAITSNGTYNVTAPAFTDVTVTSVWYKVSAANFEDVIHPAKVIITNRCVTLTSKDAEWPYDGQAHSNMTVTAEGFIEGEGVTTNGFATITNVGSEPNAFSYEFLDGTKAENYSVSCVTGTLTIAGYFVKYNGSGADGAVAEGVMEMDTFGSTIETNLTRCAFSLENFVFSGWTVNGVDKAYDDEAAGKDFAQPGETLSLTALWTRVIVPVAVTNLAHTTVSVTTNDTPVELFKTVDGCGIYNVQTNADVMIVYRADSGWAFDASGTNGTVVLSNVTWSVNDFVPEEALPKVVPITSVITEEDVEDGPDGTVIIKSCHPTADGVLIIPATIGGKVVKGIADKAFQYATWLKELVIEEGLTEIGNAAFDNCSGLALVKIPASVTKVGQVAFMRCFALERLEFAGDAPAMQKLPKLGYGVCWGAHGFTVKTVVEKEGWDDALKTLCEGWQTFSGPVDGVYTCDYNSTKVKPRITGVEWLSSGSKLTVNNVKPGLTYTLEKSACLGADWKTVGDPKTGGETDTLEFEIPGDPGTSAFFRVTVSDGSDK